MGIDVLQGQQEQLFGKVEEVKDMIKALESVNGATDRPVDEVRETVRAIYRIFHLGDKASGNDYPALSKPMGWSGEVGKGAKTAYDVYHPNHGRETKNQHPRLVHTLCFDKTIDFTQQNINANWFCNLTYCICRR